MKAVIMQDTAAMLKPNNPQKGIDALADREGYSVVGDILLERFAAKQISTQTFSE